MRRLVLLLLLTVACGFMIVTLYYPRLERVVVSGNTHYSEAQIKALANVTIDDALLWVNAWRVRKLADDPWIERVRVIRHWPHAVSIHVWERQARVLFEGKLLALDGTVLSDAEEDRDRYRESLIAMEGWGGDRSEEAIELLQLLDGYQPKVLSYSPGGFDIEFESGWLFTPSLEALREHWSGFTSQQGKSVHVYPWGVSVRP